MRPLEMKASFQLKALDWPMSIRGLETRNPDRHQNLFPIICRKEWNDMFEAAQGGRRKKYS
jgi:hypothetical protein